MQGNVGGFRGCLRWGTLFIIYTAVRCKKEASYKTVILRKRGKTFICSAFLNERIASLTPFLQLLLGVRYFWKLLASFLHLISEMSLPFCILFYDVSCTSFLLTLLYLRNRCHRLYHIALKRCGVWKLEKQAKKPDFEKMSLASFLHLTAVWLTIFFLHQILDHNYLSDFQSY